MLSDVSLSDVRLIALKRN